MRQRPMAVGIISFDRPDYLGRLLASLEAQVDAPAIDWHLFQDGAVNRYSGREVGDAARIRQSLDLFIRAELPGFKMAHRREANAGIGINQFEAYEFACRHYERIVMLEDDVVLSPYWARLLPVLFDGLEAHPDVFGFSTSFRRYCEREDIAANLDRVRLGHSHWWMVAFTADRWERVREHYLRYYELIRECDYGAIPHAQIRALFDEVGYDHAASSQDAGKDMAVWLAGMRRAVCVVNRGVSIGREGVHFNTQLFERLGFEDQEPYVFESDATRDSFEWVVDYD